MERPEGIARSDNPRFGMSLAETAYTCSSLHDVGDLSQAGNYENHRE